MRYLEWQFIVFTPIAPHFCEHGWELLGRKGSILNQRFPEPTAPVDVALVNQGTLVYEDVTHDFIKLLEKVMQKSERPPSGVVYVAKTWPEWKVIVLEALRKAGEEGFK